MNKEEIRTTRFFNIKELDDGKSNGDEFKIKSIF